MTLANTQVAENMSGVYRARQCVNTELPSSIETRAFEDFSQKLFSVRKTYPLFVCVEGFTAVQARPVFLDEVIGGRMEEMTTLCDLTHSRHTDFGALGKALLCSPLSWSPHQFSGL